MPTLAKKFVFSTLKTIAALLGLILVVYSIRPAQAASYDVVPAVINASLHSDVPPSEKTIQDVLLQVCQSRGYDEACARTMFGILWKESRGVAKAIGDQGRSRGYFQIRYKLHKISLDCAYDLRCSAEWTLTHLESRGYPKFERYAIQCHNGCNVRNGYAASTVRLSAKLWETPLLIEETQLAVAIAK